MLPSSFFLDLRRRRLYLRIYCQRRRVDFTSCKERGARGRGKQEGNGFHFFSHPVVGLGVFSAKLGDLQKGQQYVGQSIICGIILRLVTVLSVILLHLKQMLRLLTICLLEHYFTHPKRAHSKPVSLPLLLPSESFFSDCGFIPEIPTASNRETISVPLLSAGLGR